MAVELNDVKLGGWHVTLPTSSSQFYTTQNRDPSPFFRLLLSFNTNLSLAAHGLSIFQHCCGGGHKVYFWLWSALHLRTRYKMKTPVVNRPSSSVP